jgi:hypothetical protein
MPLSGRRSSDKVQPKSGSDRSRSFEIDPIEPDRIEKVQDHYRNEDRAKGAHDGSSLHELHSDKSLAPPHDLAAVLTAAVRQNQRKSVRQFVVPRCRKASAFVRHIPDHARDRLILAADREPGRVTPGPARALSPFPM